MSRSGAGRSAWLLPALAGSVASISAATSAHAAGPEQVEQIEPEGGVWQAELALTASRGETVEPSFQLLRGVSDRIAIGIEVEGDGGEVESIAPTMLLRFGDAEDGLGLGLIGQVEFATDAKPVGGEARFLIERQTARWWGQGNVIVNAEREDGRTASTLGYSWRISRALGEAVWIGGEGSGQVARLSGAALAERGHYVGPAVTIAHDLRSGSEIEFNASFVRRVAGEGPRGALLLSAQIGL